MRGGVVTVEPNSEETVMNVDIYHEQYEFSCRQCGEIWRANYDVRQVEDEQGVTL